MLHNISINYGISLEREGRICLTNDDNLSNDLGALHLNANSVKAWNMRHD